MLKSLIFLLIPLFCQVKCMDVVELEDPGAPAALGIMARPAALGIEPQAPNIGGARIFHPLFLNNQSLLFNGKAMLGFVLVLGSGIWIIENKHAGRFFTNDHLSDAGSVGTMVTGVVSIASALFPRCCPNRGSLIGTVAILTTIASVGAGVMGTYITTSHS